MFDPYSADTIGYHLFLEPKGELAQALTEQIQNLAQEYSAPVFSPHVTLLARITEPSEEDIKEKAKKLASVLKPFSIILEGFASEDRYYRALYATLRDPEEIVESYQKACDVFSITVDPEYLPHLSLLYGNYSEEQKAETRKNIILPEQRSFVADTIRLYKTNGAVENWRYISEFPLLAH